MESEVPPRIGPKRPPSRVVCRVVCSVRGCDVVRPLSWSSVVGGLVVDLGIVDLEVVVSPPKRPSNNPPVSSILFVSTTVVTKVVSRLWKMEWDEV